MLQTNINNTELKTKFEDTTEVVRSWKSKDKQYIRQAKVNTKTNNDKTKQKKT